MKTLTENFHHKRISKPRQGFSVLELMVVIVVIAILVALLLPALIIPHDGTIRIKCASNLKQVGLAFRIWEGDNGDRYPMSFYTNATGPLWMNSTNMFSYFQAMSNELSNPQVIVCPQDKTHRAATNFTTDFNSTRVSYFVGLDADETAPQRILAGDSNLKTDAPLKNGLLELTTNHSISWTRERHGDSGNVALADGSIQQYSSAALREALKHTGLTTNRLLLP